MYDEQSNAYNIIINSSNCTFQCKILEDHLFGVTILKQDTIK